MRLLHATRFFHVFHSLTSALAERFQRHRALGPRTAFLAQMTAWLSKQSLLCLSVSLYARSVTPRQLATSSLCRAFAKLTDEHVQAVMDRLSAWSLQSRPRLLRRMKSLGLPGHIYAIDGSMLTTPASADTTLIFGKPRSGNRAGTATDCHFPQARLVVLYDIARQQPVAWRVGRCRGDGGESAAAMALVEHLRPGDVVLLDRGFHSWPLLQAIRERGAFFCLRACRGKRVWRCVRAFDDGRLRHAYASIGHGDAQFQVRLVRTRPRYPKNRDDDAVIITNLTVDPRRIARIYGLRWAVEGFFRHLKITGNLESFGGRSARAVRQEIALACIAFQILAVLETCAAPLTACAIGDHARLIPRKTLLVVLQQLIEAHLGPPAQCLTRMRLAAHCVSRLGEIAPKRRPGRTFQRICKSRYGRWRAPECRGR